MGTSAARQEGIDQSSRRQQYGVNLQEQVKPEKPKEKPKVINRIKNDKRFQLRYANSLTQTDQLVLKQELKYAEDEMVPILQNLFFENFKKKRLSEYSPILKKMKKLETIGNGCCGTRIFRHQDTKKGYKCYDCQIHKDSVLCHQCFFDGDHRGHRYEDVEVDGICDCGNSEIIKEQGFCSNHSLKRYTLEESTLQNKSTKYMQFVKIIMKWVFKIYQCNYTIIAEILLQQLIQYLLQINSCNHSFLEENLIIFFREVDGEGLCLADHLIELDCKYEISHRQTVIGEKSLFEFFPKFFKDRQLQSQIFLSYCKAYSRIQYFCETQLFNYLIHLASKKDVCEKILTKRNQVEPFLHYKNRKNLFVYYQQLHQILKAMPNEMAAEFIKPFLQEHIPFPYMRKTYKKKYNKICQTQYLYLDLQIKIISLISDKRQLCRLIKKYIQMGNHNKDCQPGLQVPHKVIGLILLKYSENNLNNLNHSARQFEPQIKEFFFKMLQKSFQNLRRFCCMIAYKNRRRFYWSYQQYYKKNHSIYYDMLIVQAVIRIIPDRATQIENIILNMIQFSQEVYIRKKFQQDSQSLVRYLISMRRLKINLLNMLGEIVYSKIPELYFGARLKQYDAIKVLSEETLQSMFNSLEEMSESRFNSIKEFIFDGYLPQEIIQKIATFNSKTKMYRIRQQRGQKINFNIFISLAQTELYSLYTNYVLQAQMQRQVILTKTFDCFSQQNRKMFHPIFSNKIIQCAFQQIIIIIDDQTSFQIKNDMFKMAIKLNKTLSNLYCNKDLLDQNFEMIKNAMLKLAQVIEFDPQQYYIENYFLINQSQAVMQKKEENRKEDIQRLKERQRQKRQALMRSKKIKENQQLLAAKEEKIQEPAKEQDICVICRQKGKLCYLTQISFTNLIFHYFNMSGINFTLDTCQHTIHYGCFILCRQKNNIGRCPLCRKPFNTVIPIDFEDSQQLDKCWNYYEYFLEGIRIGKRNLLEECLLYLYYQQKMLDYFKLEANSQDLLKNKFIMTLVKHMQMKFGFTESEGKYIDSDFTFRVQFQRFKYKILGIQTLVGEKKPCKQLLPEIEQVQQSSDVEQCIIYYDESHLKSKQDNQMQAEQAVPKKSKWEEHIFDIPFTIEDYLYFRDKYILTKKRSLSPMLCLLCNMSKIHDDYQCLPSLFLNIQKATIQYRPYRTNKIIFEIYQDKDGQPWSIKKKAQGFALNRNLLDTILRALVNNNKQFLEKAN